MGKYLFSDLSEEAKKIAIENHREDERNNDNWSDTIIDEWVEKLEKLGFENPQISFNGFLSQGDGASFTYDGISISELSLEWLFAGLSPKQKSAFKDQLDKNIIGIVASGRRIGRYFHENSIVNNVEIDTSEENNFVYKSTYDKLHALIEANVKTLQVGLSKRIYNDLSNLYNTINSDEAISEFLSEDVNDYYFFEDGSDYDSFGSNEPIEVDERNEKFSATIENLDELVGKELYITKNNIPKKINILSVEDLGDEIEIVFDEADNKDAGGSFTMENSDFDFFVENGIVDFANTSEQLPNTQTLSYEIPVECLDDDNEQEILEIEQNINVPISTPISQQSLLMVNGVEFTREISLIEFYKALQQTPDKYFSVIDYLDGFGNNYNAANRLTIANLVMQANKIQTTIPDNFEPNYFFHFLDINIQVEIATAGNEIPTSLRYTSNNTENCFETTVEEDFQNNLYFVYAPTNMKILIRDLIPIDNSNSVEAGDLDPIWGFDDADYSEVREFLKEKITEKFGKENTYSGSADWGGMPVWTVKGDKFQGTFIVIDDNDEVFLMTRKTDEDEENEDEDIISASNPDQLELLFEKAEELKNASTFRTDGYFTISNSSSILVEISDSGDAVRYKYSFEDDDEAGEAEIMYDTDEEGRAYFVTDNDVKVYLSNVMRTNI